jgi:hypothetical protein
MNELKPECEEPVGDASRTFHFVSNPDFCPNKSPEIIREGSFGGSYLATFILKTFRHQYTR